VKNYENVSNTNPKIKTIMPTENLKIYNAREEMDIGKDLDL
jgi:hypothetical protein